MGGMEKEKGAAGARRPKDWPYLAVERLGGLIYGPRLSQISIEVCSAILVAAIAPSSYTGGPL